MGKIKPVSKDIIFQNKIFVWIALATMSILAIPLVAMQFTNEVYWTLFDFIVMGALLFGTGFLFIQVARITSPKYRKFIGLVFAAGLLAVWAELAVGIFGTPIAGN